MPFCWSQDDTALKRLADATDNARQVSRPSGRGQNFRELFGLKDLLRKGDNLRVQDPGPIRAANSRVVTVSKIALSVILYLTMLFLASLLGGAS